MSEDRKKYQRQPTLNMIVFLSILWWIKIVQMSIDKDIPKSCILIIL